MKKIKFELTENDTGITFLDAQHVIAEISLNGESIEDYLVAFKSFLIACGFVEETVSEIITREQAFLDFEERERLLTNCE
jgi:hypothetical protein